MQTTRFELGDDASSFSSCPNFFLTRSLSCSKIPSNELFFLFCFLSFLFFFFFYLFCFCSLLEFSAVCSALMESLCSLCISSGLFRALQNLRLGKRMFPRAKMKVLVFCRSLVGCIAHEWIFFLWWWQPDRWGECEGFLSLTLFLSFLCLLLSAFSRPPPFLGKPGEEDGRGARDELEKRD